MQDLVDAVTPLQARAAFDQLEGTLTTRIREIDAALFDLSARVSRRRSTFPTRAITSSSRKARRARSTAIGRSIDALLADAGRGRLVREGAQVVIVGRPNAGKSSLFNRLAGAGRAIVTDIPGTTRDLLTESSTSTGCGDAGRHRGPARGRGRRVERKGSRALTPPAGSPI